MSGKYYMLVNPYVQGTTQTIFKADNSLEAAKNAYESLSQYFNNSVHNFKFSLLKLKSEQVGGENTIFDMQKYTNNNKSKRLDSNNFSHYVVSESRSKNDNVKYALKKLDSGATNMEHIINNIIKIQNKLNKDADSSQSGGKSDEDSKKSSESSESSGSSESSKSSGSSDSESDKKKQPHLQFGGKSKKHSKRSKYDDKDDSEDEDDSPDYYVRKSYYVDPIYYYYYYPLAYTMDKLYLPTFSVPLYYNALDLTSSINYNIANPTLSVNLS
jgi:hypothetical protein